MKKLQSFSKSLFPNLVLFQLLSDLWNAVQSGGSETLKTFVKRLLDAFEKAFADYDRTLIAAKTAEAPLTFDRQRDWGIRELYSIASVYEDHFLDEAKQAAARFLLEIFKRYGTGSELANIAQEKESGSLTNILQEISAENARPHVAALGVEKLVAYTAESNTGFINARRAVTEENMQLAGQVKTARTAAEKAWDNLRDAINGYAAVNIDDAQCAALIDSLNAIIEHHKQSVRRSQAATKPSDNTPQPEAGK